jgi:sigma-E factor negative regulatory protein RseC
LIEEQGQVVATEGEYVWVATEQPSSCGQCSAQKGCGTAVLSSVFQREAAKIKVLNQVQARTGDWVVLGLQENALLKGAFAVYLIPILSMLVVAGLAHGLWQPLPEWAAISAGLIGLAIGLFWLRHFSRHISSDIRYQPVILRRVVFPVSDCHT